MKKSIILIVLCIIVSGCSKVAKIEQFITVDSYVNCTYEVMTTLRVYDSWIESVGFSCGVCEEILWKYNIPKEKVECIKEKQYTAMFEKYVIVQGFIDSGIEPCNE